MTNEEFLQLRFSAEKMLIKYEKEKVKLFEIRKRIINYQDYVW